MPHFRHLSLSLSLLLSVPINAFPSNTIRANWILLPFLTLYSQFTRTFARFCSTLFRCSVWVCSLLKNVACRKAKNLVLLEAMHSRKKGFALFFWEQSLTSLTKSAVNCTQCWLTHTHTLSLFIVLKHKALIRKECWCFVSRNSNNFPPSLAVLLIDSRFTFALLDWTGCHSVCVCV